jgi:tetratricopeptide (TPR) repeat protein
MTGVNPTRGANHFARVSSIARTAPGCCDIKRYAGPRDVSWWARCWEARMVDKSLRTISFGLAFLGLLTLTPSHSPAQFSGRSGSSTHPAVRVWQGTLELPTYQEGLPDENPPFDQFVTNGRYNYPYTVRENLTNRVAPRRWRTLNLENEYLKCVILPDLGGHLYRCLDKRNGADLFYANPSLKFARIAYRGVWAAYGIEFNFPVSHNWMTASPVDFSTSIAPDGSASVWVRNIDRVYGMEWCVELRLHPGQAVLEQKTTLYNPSLARHRFYWWTNAGVQVWDDSRLYYPQQFSVFHGFTGLDTWPVDRAGVDLSVVGNHKYGPVSRFSFASNEPYMAVYHSKTNAGVVHYATRSDLPSKKVFSWGGDTEGLAWRNALSDNHSAYIEIQAGLFRDQETYGFLDPQQAIHFTEYWIPIREIGGVTRANSEAVLNLTRAPSQKPNAVSLDVALNVTRDYPKAKVELREASQVIATESVSLTPRATYQKQFSDLPAGKTYTVTLADESGKTVLTHTEGKYDFVPKSEVPKELPPAYVYPPSEKRTESDVLELGTEQERNGMVLDALSTYREGLKRFPVSVVLHRAAGRLDVALNQFVEATEQLSPVLMRISNDKETSYYLGIAYAATGEWEKSRSAFEVSVQYGGFRAPSLYELAALDARKGELKNAHEKLAAANREFPYAARVRDMDVALLRILGETKAAEERLKALRLADPANTFLGYEATRLGQKDAALWEHLAADPERILAIAVLYIHFGLYDEALKILARQYPSGGGVVSEPGMPRPERYPLIAYYRAYCREMLHQDANADFLVASQMPTIYVFPNRPDSLDVLERAIFVNPTDANAHALLGSLYMSGGMQDAAMTEWNAARELNPAIPALLRNMGYTVLYSKQSPERAIQLFEEGTKSDPQNAEIYLGLEQALREAGHTTEERVAALQKFPGPTPPATLIFQLARDLADAGRYEEAQSELETRYVSLEEGGTNQSDVYLEIKLKQARALAAKQQCDEARTLIQHLSSDPVPQLSLTKDTLALALQSPRTQKEIAEVQAPCQK